MRIRHLLLILSLAAVIDARAAGTSLEELVEQSQFVFKGTVTKVNAATLPQIRATAKSSTVWLRGHTAESRRLFSFAAHDLCCLWRCCGLIEGLTLAGRRGEGTAGAVWAYTRA